MMSPDKAKTTLIQRALCYEGLPVAIDGVWGRRTATAVNAYRARGQPAGAIFSGFASPPVPSQSPPSDTSPPTQDSAALNAYFGEPREDYPHLTAIRTPYEMRLSWQRSQKVTKISCHKRIAEPLLAALESLLEAFGRDGIIEHGLDLYAGVFNHRKIRGGSKKWSLHAYGAAIDLNPDANGWSTPWRVDRIGEPGFASMPTLAIECFEKQGFLSGAREWGRDAMHFQYTK